MLEQCNVSSCRYEETVNDFPNHQAGQTSSIGGLWPAESASFDRIKAFYTQAVIASNSDLEPFIESWRNGMEAVNSENNQATRVQYRGLFNADFLAQARLSHIEAVIPLDPGHLGQDTVLAYFGYNNLTRGCDPQDKETISQNINTAMRTRIRSVDEMIARPEGYSIRTFDRSDYDEQRVDQMHRLYQRFGWSRDDVIQLLINRNNIIGTATFNGQIVSAGIAELAHIPIGDDHSMRMVEITEAATEQSHEGNGLYAAVSTALIREVADRSLYRDIFGGEVDLVFGECNGLSTGVLKVARTQGRHFAPEFRSFRGITSEGILRQQVPIQGAEKRTEYNDLVPAFLGREQLHSRFRTYHEKCG